MDGDAEFSGVVEAFDLNGDQRAFESFCKLDKGQTGHGGLSEKGNFDPCIIFLVNQNPDTATVF